jgi:hypothetical protein
VVRASNLHEKLVLTYDSAAMTDGVGAQLQRIYGIYSVARLLGAAYLHSAIERVDYQGLAALERNVGNPDFHREFNEVFQIDSAVSPTEEFDRVHTGNISIDLIQRLVRRFDNSETRGRRILLCTAVPFGIADAFPDCYRVCKEVSPFKASPRETRPLRVVVHVRRGELFVVATDRMLPNDYYITAALEVAQVLEALRLDYQLELWTEVPRNDLVVAPDQHGMAGRLAEPAVISPAMSRLEDFDVLPYLVRRINGEALDSLRAFATADILVMSRSSFSYVGAILNQTGIVLYPKFWHAAPSWWITVGPQGHLDQAELRAAVQGLP